MKRLLITLLLLLPFSAQAEQLRVVSTAQNYTATKFDDVIQVDATAGARTVTLPAASTAKGKTLVIKKVDSTTNAVTTSAIEGAARSFATLNTAVTIYSDGSSWRFHGTDEQLFRTVSAVVDGSCVATPIGTWMSSSSSTDSGNTCTITAHAYIFAGTPHCTCSYAGMNVGSGPTEGTMCEVLASSSTSWRVLARNSSGNLNNSRPKYVICRGPR